MSTVTVTIFTVVKITTSYYKIKSLIHLTGNLFDDTPAHLPDDGYFDKEAFICGPLHVVPIGATKFNVENYADVKQQFNLLNKIK